MICTTEIEKRVAAEHPERIKALVRTYNGGRYGRGGEYVAIVKPRYFKNGNLKTGDFDVVEILETRKKEYGYGGCSHSKQIAKILDIIA